MRDFIARHIARRITLTMLCLLATAANAQVKGVVVDEDNGDSIAFVTVSYKNKKINSVGDTRGRYSIARHDGWTLTFSAVGYKSKQIKINASTPQPLNVSLKPDNKFLDEVTVKSKKSKYRRKDNPAVELMRRVIAAKQSTKLENKDFYQYRNYEKLTVSLNDISQATLKSNFVTKRPWLKEQIETNPLTGKKTLPISVTEKISHKMYRKSPEKERILVDAEKTYGITELVETGEIFTTAVQDAFTEIDIYDDHVRLLQFPFTSPIGKDAIGFYRYYIVDTVKVERDSCYHVAFMPNNQQDFGFRGEIWILKDSTLHVKKVHLGIPKRSDVNFVTNMSIDQEYLHLPSGDWVLSVNDMIVEMSIVGNNGNFLVCRTSRRNDYSFDPIDEKLFKGKAKEKRDPYSAMRDADYWIDNREVALTKGEEGMDGFLDALRHSKGFAWMLAATKVLAESYLETSLGNTPSKVDIGPVNSMLSTNDIDGLRLRVTAQTTANLNRHLFLKGYAAYGTKTRNTYYSGTMTYSFNKKAYGPHEFPMRNISFTSTYDICSPSDKFLTTDKDNVFTSFKWSKVMNMAFYKRQSLDFVREEDWGFTTSGGIKFEENSAAGDLYFRKQGDTAGFTDGSQGKFRISEAYLQIGYQPGQEWVNTKQRRKPINRDAPIFRLKHTVGIKGFMGGEYDYNVTEASIYKRFWMKSWGKMDVYLKGGYQWNQVPFPLLIAPAANLSLVWRPETFGLVNNMEFLNDRYVSLHTEWDLNGKLFNRIPLLKHLQWRELIGFNMLYGGLSDKNNPFLAANAANSRLMEFPEGAYLMQNGQPYMEFRIGVHNILKLFQIEYVRRLNYLDQPTAKKHGMRVGFRLTF